MVSDSAQNFVDQHVAVFQARYRQIREQRVARDQEATRRALRIQRRKDRMSTKPPVRISNDVRAVMAPILERHGATWEGVTEGHMDAVSKAARSESIVALYQAFPDRLLKWYCRPFGFGTIEAVRHILIRSGVYKTRNASPVKKEVCQ